MTESEIEIKKIMNASRLVMLMEPMAAEFNDILMTAPIRRVILVAEVLKIASDLNDSIGNNVKSSNVMQALFNESKRRGDGSLVMPKAFLPDLENLPSRELSHV